MMRTKSTEGRVPSISHSDSLQVSLCSTWLLGSNILQGAVAEAAHLCSRKAEQPWEGAPARWACPPAGQLAGPGGMALLTGAWWSRLQRWALCLAQHWTYCLSGLQACRGISQSTITCCHAIERQASLYSIFMLGSAWSSADSTSC